MIPLLNAIYSKFTGTAALVSAFPGGLHRDEAAKGTSMPYVVTEVADGTIDDGYGNATENAMIIFKAIGLGHDAVGNKIKTLTDIFDNTSLTLSTGTNFSMRRLTPAIAVKLPKEDHNGQDVWQFSVVYEYSYST